MSDLMFLFLGFTVAWLLVFGYVLSIGKRSSALEERLDRIESATDESG